MKTRQLRPAREARSFLAGIGTLLGWLRRRNRDVFAPAPAYACARARTGPAQAV
jgi:hypothetical protein